VVLLLFSCAAPARSSRASAPLASAAPAGERVDDDVTCALEVPTGSHIARRICRSAREREALSVATQDSLRHPSTTGEVDDFSIVVTHVGNP
jgi:hypothetical protein